MTIQSSRRCKNKISCGIYAGRGVTGASDTLLSVYLINIVFDETDIDKTVLELGKKKYLFASKDVNFTSIVT